MQKDKVERAYRISVGALFISELKKWRLIYEQQDKTLGNGRNNYRENVKKLFPTKRLGNDIGDSCWRVRS